MNMMLFKFFRLLLLFVSIVLVLLIIDYLFARSSDEFYKIPANHIKPIVRVMEKVTEKRKQQHFRERIIHLDLKGAPPKISYYRKIFPLLLQLGATGLLMEYEDMFPYTGRLANISAYNAYSIEEISIINKLAKENKLKIIPFIQVIGQMEFILKLADFKEFREVPSYPEVICPNHKNTVFLLVTIIQQILRAHPDSDMIHIGTDEVNYLGQCSRCYQYLRNNRNSKNFLFLNHLKNVTSVLKIMYPELRILMWDSQTRSMPIKEIEEIGLNTNIEPAVLKYTNDIYEDLGPTLWENYGKTFKNVWASSAYKGISDDNEFISNFNKHLINHKGWLSILNEYGDIVNFEGIILAGWQRRDHFSALTELLPVAIPSIAISLRLLSGYIESPLNPPVHVAKILLCKQPYALLSSAFGSPKCSYPGGDILEYFIQLHQLMQEYDAIVGNIRYSRWMNEYNIKYSFSSPSRVESFTPFLSKIKNDLSAIEIDITVALSEVYDKYTVEEWKDTFIKPLKQKVQSLWEVRKKILMKETWPRRPLMKNEL